MAAPGAGLLRYSSNATPLIDFFSWYSTLTRYCRRPTSSLGIIANRLRFAQVHRHRHAKNMEEIGKKLGQPVVLDISFATQHPVLVRDRTWMPADAGGDGVDAHAA